MAPLVPPKILLEHPEYRKTKSLFGLLSRKQQERELVVTAQHEAISGKGWALAGSTSTHMTNG
jgi:hypothetical protein